MAKKVVITSGFFNPIHVGHVNLIKAAKQLGDYLVVIVNNDNQVNIKGSAPFMPEQERMEIIGALQGVDEVFLSVDQDGFIAESLKMIAEKYNGNELLFAKGGDRNLDNLPESEKKICQDFAITVVSGVGGGKIQSSSWLINKVKT